jgi:RimJ/RimL family protein N-acetyltransferase
MRPIARMINDKRGSMTQALPLLTPRLLLRKLTPADLPQLARYRSLPEVARFQSWDHYTEHDAQTLYAQQCSLAFNSEGTWYQLAVERLDVGRLSAISAFISLMREDRLNWV